MELGKLPVPGRPTNLDNSRTDAVGAGGVVWTFLLSYIICLSPSLRDRPILTEILSQRASQLKTTNQP